MKRYGAKAAASRRLLYAVVALFVIWRLWQSFDQPTQPAALDEGIYRVERVVDGDTLLLVGGDRVRLIGVDTPETVKPDHPVEPWGPEASDFTKQFVAGGEVRLQFDRQRVDQYGRRLAYVWVDDRMLNEELLRAGLGRALLQHRYSPAMKRRFEAAQEEAQREGRGIWSVDTSGRSSRRGFPPRILHVGVSATITTASSCRMPALALLVSRFCD